MRGKFLAAGEEKLWVRGVTYGTFPPGADSVEFPSRETVDRDLALMAASGMRPAFRPLYFHPSMRYLIVNGDDFGVSGGINRGIVEAHKHGILTSASLLVNAAASEQAAALGRSASGPSVGLHVDLPPLAAPARVRSPRRLRRELREQIGRFESLMGGLPAHIDSHHNVHRDPGALPLFLELAREHRLPLRDQPPVRCVEKLYARGEERLTSSR